MVQIEMSEEIRKATVVLLYRVQLQGSEVPVFNEILKCFNVNVQVQENVEDKK